MKRIEFDEKKENVKLTIVEQNFELFLVSRKNEWKNEWINEWNIGNISDTNPSHELAFRWIYNKSY